MKNASLTGESPPRASRTRRWIRSPSAWRRSSMPSASPAIPPSSTPPSTYSGLVSRQASARSMPITSVTRPSPASTRRWIPSGQPAAEEHADERAGEDRRRR